MIHDRDNRDRGPEEKDGRTREWTDRARVTDPEENLRHSPSINQSNVPEEDDKVNDRFRAKDDWPIY